MSSTVHVGTKHLGNQVLNFCQNSRRARNLNHTQQKENDT